MSDGPENKTPDLCRMLLTAIAMISMIGEVIIMPIPEIRISITLFAARWSTASPIFLDTRSGVSKKMDAFTSHKNDVRNLRTHIASDRMCKTVFQITVSLC